MTMKKKLSIIFYAIYVLAIIITLYLSKIDILDLNIFTMIYMVLIAIIFLVCCNMFYVPRQMDTIQMLDNKNQMKSDPILWKPLVYLETPLAIAMLMIIVF